MGLNANCLLCSWIGPTPAITKKRIYTKDVIDKCNEDHKKAFGPESEIATGGYPDQGEGWYSRKMPYKDQIEQM